VDEAQEHVAKERRKRPLDQPYERPSKLKKPNERPSTQKSNDDD
jgi:hypothetical protein